MASATVQSLSVAWLLLPYGALIARACLYLNERAQVGFIESVAWRFYLGEVASCFVMWPSYECRSPRGAMSVAKGPADLDECFPLLADE